MDAQDIQSSRPQWYAVIPTHAASDACYDIHSVVLFTNTLCQVLLAPAVTRQLSRARDKNNTYTRIIVFITTLYMLQPLRPPNRMYLSLACSSMDFIRMHLPRKHVPLKPANALHHNGTHLVWPSALIPPPVAVETFLLSAVSESSINSASARTSHHICTHEDKSGIPSGPGIPSEPGILQYHSGVPSEHVKPAYRSCSGACISSFARVTNTKAKNGQVQWLATTPALIATRRLHSANEIKDLHTQFG